MNIYLLYVTLSGCSEMAFIQSLLLRLPVCFTAAQLLKAFCFISPT